MARRIGLDGLADAIDEILEEYADEIAESADEAVQKVTKAGVKAMRQESAAAFPGGDGTYAKGWTSKTDKGRLRSESLIYNRTPGLPHLLEHGHVSRNGTGRTFGTVPGREHIAPVAEKIAEDFEKEIEVAIT